VLEFERTLAVGFKMQETYWTIIGKGSRTFALASILLGLVGCSRNEQTKELMVVSGGVLGAGLGAVIGSQSGNAGKGAIIGAFAGTTLGTLAACSVERTPVSSIEQIAGVSPAGLEANTVASEGPSSIRETASVQPVLDSDHTRLAEAYSRARPLREHEIAALKAKLAARKDRPGYGANVKALQQRIAELEGADDVGI